MSDRKIVCLMQAGMKKPEAKAFCWLLENKQGTSVEIERGADIRQPEVSLAMKCMKERDWLICKHISQREKGRPKNHYSLKSEKAISDIENKIKNEIKSIQSSINEIQSLLGS